MVSAPTYILSALAMTAVALSLGFSAYRLRCRFLQGWDGAPARLVESVAGIALLIWLGEILGTFGLLYGWTIVAASLLVAGATAVLSSPRVLSPGGPGLGGPARSATGMDSVPGSESSAPQPPGSASPAPPTPPAGGSLALLITVGVVALVFAHWGLTAKDALDRGMFNFDSLWYHMPFAADIAQSHSVTGLHYTDTVFTNWLYPQNSELLHAVGILLTQRDTLSLFINFAFLGIAFLAAWCIGRPYGRGPLTVTAAAVLLECHTLVVREPGAAKNDVVAAALLLAAVAILISAAHLPRVAWRRGSPMAEDAAASEHMGDAAATGPAADPFALAAAGLAIGLAVGTKSTAFAMAAALTVAVVVLAPIGRRLAALAWWSLAALAGGGYWYLRNLIVAGNPLPQLESLGPISLPHPERLQSGRPDFSIVHYATDTGVWRDYFGPGLDHAFGALWPLVVGAAIAGALGTLVWGKERVLRWMGGVALFAMLAYLVTPLSAAGAEGAPTGFAINIRYAIPALLTGIALLPLAVLRSTRAFAPAAGGRDRIRGLSAWSLVDWTLLGVLLAILAVTDRADAVLRDPDRLFGLLVVTIAVLIPAGLLYGRRRGASQTAVATGFVALALSVVAIGYPVQRDYLEARFRNDDPETSIPGFDLDSAYRWARDVEGSRIGLAGTTVGFLQYGFYGTDLSNRVRYLGVKAPHGGFEAIPTCAGFRAAVDAADLDYLITSPFLNFIQPADPVPSPEATWLRGEPAVVPIDRSGPVTVWKVRGRLSPAACGPANVPLRRVPDTALGSSQSSELASSRSPSPGSAGRRITI